MPANLIVVGDWDKRLTIEAKALEVRSIHSPGDGYTSLVLERNTSANAHPNVRPVQRPHTNPVPSGPPAPPPDITMSVVGGLPAGISPIDLQNAERVSGPVTLADLAGRLHAMPDGDQKILIVDPT